MLRSGLRRRVRDTMRSVGATPTSLYERNVRNVMIDGMGVGIVTGVGTFLSVFLARLGASGVVIGLLTAMPAIAGAFLALPLGAFIGRRTNLILWYARSRLWVLSSYALTGLVPFVVDRTFAPAAIIVIWALATVPQTLVNICFTMVMSTVAGPTKRLELMTRRWTTVGISTALSVAAAGWALEQVAFPRNYQIVFICSFAGGLLSYAFSTNIQLPVAETPAPAPTTRGSALSRLRHMFRAHPRFSAFLISQFVFRCGMAMSMPLFPLYWVRVVNASDASIGLINTVQSSVLLVAYTAWAFAARKRGAAVVLIASAFGLVLYPLLTSLTLDVRLLIAYAALAGIFIAGSDLVIFDVLIATAPERERAAAIGAYHTTNYVATFAAPLIGTLAAEQVGIAPMLLTAAALRFGGGLLFLLLGVGRDPTTTDR